MNRIISVIIPTYNEEKVIEKCLINLSKQIHKPLEIIVVDDGSSDSTVKIIQDLKSRMSDLKLLNQKHLGPGPARNLGAKSAKGDILVFVDSDMTFDKNFIKDLTNPIFQGKTIGTFSKNEMNANSDNIWSTCWNINKGLPPNLLIPPNYPSNAPVFRAILKKEFDKVGGFDVTGEYTDDWSLSRKLGKRSTLAKGAIYYHTNPDNLTEVFRQARWIGKNEFISGNLIRRLRSIVFYCLPVSMTIAAYKSIKSLNVNFIVFKLVYDIGVFISVIRSFFNEKKAK